MRIDRKLHNILDWANWCIVQYQQWESSEKERENVPGELLRYLSQYILKKFFFIYKRTQRQTLSLAVRNTHNVLPSAAEKVLQFLFRKSVYNLVGANMKHYADRGDGELMKAICNQAGNAGGTGGQTDTISSTSPYHVLQILSSRR